MLYGSSWGSTLALAYTLSHPGRVHALVIGAVFTASKAELDWVDKGRFKLFFPEVWRTYLGRTPVDYHSDPSMYHFDKVINGTAEEQKVSGYAYAQLETSIIQLDDRSEREDIEEFDSTSTRLAIYYLANGCFLPENYILNNVHTLTMPVHIVQGRYDMLCPPRTAYELDAKLQNSRLYWALSGHKAEHENENILRSIFAAMY